MSTYSTYYTIMSMIDGFKSFINLAVMVLTIVASWIMYAKAGEHGWAAIVPFYSSYVKFRIAGKQKLFWGYLVASIASIAGCILLMYEIIASGLSVMTSSYMGSYYDSTYGYAGNRIGAHMGMLIFAVILIIAAMIAALVMNILCCVGLAHAFGKANRRGKRRGLSWGITKKEKEMFREKLKMLDLGLEDRMTSKVGLLSGGQRQALTLLMATLKKPSLLLLDEHTAALDPKTAKKVLDITEKIVAKDNLTTMMVTHNMKDAINIGNRLIMMSDGKIIYDVKGEEKKKLKVADLLQKFEEASGGEFANDRMLLS